MLACPERQHFWRRLQEQTAAHGLDDWRFLSLGIPDALTGSLGGFKPTMDARAKAQPISQFRENLRAVDDLIDVTMTTRHSTGVAAKFTYYTASLVVKNMLVTRVRRTLFWQNMISSLTVIRHQLYYSSAFLSLSSQKLVNPRLSRSRGFLILPLLWGT